MMKARLLRIAIPVLLCAFGAVALRPLLNPDSKVDDIDTSQSRRRVQALAAADIPPAVTIPRYDLDSLLAFDPFRPLGSSQKNAAVVNDANASEESAVVESTDVDDATSPTETKVALQAVFEDASGKIAIIGSQIVHVGDVLENGLRVQLITTDGVVLSKE